MTSHHQMPAHEVVLLLETDVAKGLSSHEAAKRLARSGPNVLPKFQRHGPLLRFLFQFHHPPIYVLLAATVITALFTAMLLLQIVMTYLPIMNRLFGTVPLDGQAWLLILVVSVLVYLVVGAEKWLRRQWHSRRASAASGPRGA